MNKLIKIVSAAIVALMLISVCIASGASSGEMNFSSQTRHVDDDLFDYPEADFTKIQDAINASSEGDTIIVHNGTYYETVILNKSLSLLGKELPTIDAEVNGSAIEIDAPGCVVRGFRCRASGTANQIVLICLYSCNFFAFALKICLLPCQPNPSSFYGKQLEIS